MKKKNISKKILAVLLSAIIIATTMPFVVVSAIGEGSYDPAPYWGDGSNNAALNTNFIATLNADTSLSVAFPKANPQKTYNGGAQKTITNYIFTITKLTDDGERKEIWSENFNLNSMDGRIGTFTVDNTTGNRYPNSIYYRPGEFQSLGEYEDEASYDISIKAVDSDGWISDTIHTLLTETPYYIVNDDFSPNESWVVREMLLFEQKGTSEINGNSQSNNGVDGSMYSEVNEDQSQMDFLYNANGLVDANGRLSGMGYADGSANKYGYRFWVNSAYTGTPFKFETTWSRDHYNFTGADEVWFYVDMSRVAINKVAFTLSANEKSIKHFRDDTTNGALSQYGATFSTVAVNGKNTGTISEGIYIQNADGLWESSSMTDGYFTDLAGYKGFIRIPIKYFVLQSDQYITGQSSLDDWNYGGCDRPAANDENLTNYVNNERIKQGDKLILPVAGADGTKEIAAEPYGGFYAIKINSAGTCVTDAIVVYERRETYGNGNSVQTLDMLGFYSESDVVETIESDNTRTFEAKNPIYAISDLISAGIQVADWSNESVHKSFYIDQVMFCKQNTGSAADFDANGYVVAGSSLAFPSEANVSNNTSGNYGRRMAGFYDRTVEVPKAVAGYIMQYFGQIPSLNDINAKAMVDDIILEYIDCFGVNSSALSDEAKVEAAIETLQSKHPDAYNKYKAAVTFIETYTTGGLDTTTSAVEAFESGVESLPNPQFANYNDKELHAKLEQLRALYETFNLSHYALLGADAEAKFLELHSLIVGEEVKTGQSIGAYPFIPFNDFETNYTLGQLSDMYYDDSNRSGNKPADINNTGNFTTYVSDDVIDQPGEVGGTAIGWSPMDYRATGNPTFNNSADFSKMDAQITNNGFADSLGATFNLNGNLVCNPSGNDWSIATLSTTYLGAEATTWGNLPGLDLSGIAVKTDSTNGTDAEDVARYGEGVIPNSFVMYVDFTDVEKINFNVKFILQSPSGEDVNCYFCGGTETDTPVIYLLNENGDWEAQKLKVTQTDIEAASTLVRDVTPGLCTIAPSELNTLEGYKGFIRIPLSNFRIPTYSGILNINVDYNILDNILDDGYTIKQAKISVWDEAANNEGKKIVIDSLGFTYDPKCTNRVSGNTNCNGELNQDNGINVINMDEYFKVKTTDSSNFEKMVATIDPYAGKSSFEAAFDNAIKAYEDLSDYQKNNIQEVGITYNELLLDKYQALRDDYDTVIQQEQWKPIYTNAQQLLADLALVSSNAKQYKIAEESISQLYDTHKEDFMNQLGFASVEEAQNVVTMYEIGYNRLSIAERESISAGDLEALNNAYDAAQRAVLINGIIGDVENFKANITAIYGDSTHTDDDADRIPDTEDPNGGNRMVKYLGTVQDTEDNTVNALKYYTDMYNEISAFGKKLLNDDTDTARAYKNMYDAAKAIYDNSTAVIPNAGASVPGGIITYERRLEAAYADAKAKIDARTILDTATLNEIEYCLGQYEAFLRRYALVDELNYDYVQLALLLPTADLATSDMVVLTNADENPLYKDTADANLTYAAARLGRTVSVYLVTDYKWTQTAGSTYNFGYFTVNGATGSDGTVAYTKLGDYGNGEKSAFAPEISVNETAAKKVPTGNQYEGTVKLMAFDSAMIKDGVDMSTLAPVATIEIPIMFVSTNGAAPIFYTVSIPASMEVDWNQTAPEDVSYTVNNAQLNGGTLTIGVADNTGHAGQLTNTVTNDVLTYTASNFKDYVFGDITTDTKPDPAPTVTVSGWDDVPVGEYRTTLTYTVVYDDGTT